MILKYSAYKKLDKYNEIYSNETFCWLSVDAKMRTIVYTMADTEVGYWRVWIK